MKVAEVRVVGGQVYVITKTQKYGATCNGVACRATSIEKMCRHIRAYHRAVLVGKHLIVQEHGESLVVRLLMTDGAGGVSDMELAAYDLAASLQSAAGIGFGTAKAAERILAFAEEWGAKVPRKTGGGLAGKTRRILVLDESG